MSNSKPNAKTNPIGVNMQRLQDLLNQYREHQPNTQGIPFENRSDRYPDTTEDDESGIDANERRMLTVLKFCLLGAMGFFCFENIRPYIDLVDLTVVNWSSTNIFGMVSKLPVLGWLVTGGIAITSLVISLILWGSLQLLELLPSFMMDSPKFLLSNIAYIQNWQRIKAGSADTAIARKLKAHYNSIPQQAIERANVARAVAYIIDAAICIAFYEPVEGGMRNLALVFNAGAWDYIRWDKVISVFVTLFAVEAIYWIYKIVLSIARTHFQNN
jgi:hypothetical protein